MSKYLLIIGCDVSKSVIDISYREHSNSEVVYLGRYSNNEKGFVDFKQSLLELTSSKVDTWFICFENTGVYSKKLLHWSIENKILCKEEDPIRISRSLGIRRGKSDKLDSKVICQYAFEKQDSLTLSTLIKPELGKIKKLLSRRDLLVKHRTALHVSLKEQKGVMEDELLKSLMEANDILIRTYNEQIKELEKSIKTIIESDEELERNDNLVQSVVGVGHITSAYILSITNNFKEFKDAKKFACYCGISPFPNSSGTKNGRRRVSHLANKKMKSLLSNCILSTLRYDPEISKYYARKKEEGKKSGVVFNAIKNKLIQRVFAVVKRGTPYVKIMTYA